MLPDNGAADANRVPRHLCDISFAGANVSGNDIHSQVEQQSASARYNFHKKMLF